jgi:hypothetical protein
MRRVKDFSDIPLLFAEGENDMGAPKKTRAELLDKFIQFVWDYQQKHNGETPTLVTVGQNIGIKGGGEGYYTSILIDEGRLNRISVRPFRATITDHPKNTSAIGRYKRLLAKKEAFEAAERERIRAEQASNAEASQRAEDKEAVFAAISDSVDVQKAPALAEERPAIPLAPLVKVADRYVGASDQYRAAQRALKTEMPRLIKFADERDLVFELLNRGYTVKKN